MSDNSEDFQPDSFRPPLHDTATPEIRGYKFQLILAVIIIMGILLTLVVPSVKSNTSEGIVKSIGNEEIIISEDNQSKSFEITSSTVLVLPDGNKFNSSELQGSNFFYNLSGSIVEVEYKKITILLLIPLRNKAQTIWIKSY